MNTRLGEVSLVDSVDEIGLILSGVVVLQELDFDVVQDIACRMQAQSYRSGDILLEQGARGDRLLVIYSGRVEIDGGEDSGPTSLGKGSLLGELGILTGRACPADIVALSETRVLYLARPDFLDLMARHAGFAEAMSRLVADHMLSDPGFKRLQHFRLLKKLGDGILASVFEASDPTFNRRVALKMLNFSLTHNPAFASRFEREENRITGLHHPNIVHIHALLQEYSTRFLVMEKLRGESLQSVLDREGSLSVMRTREILFPIAAALRYAHSQGVVHGAVRPSNIFVDDVGNVKLTDFGLFHPGTELNQRASDANPCLAPETIAEGRVDRLSDIHALGVTAYYMLTGQPPADGARDVREYCPEVDEDMAMFVSKALASEAEERIADWNLIRVLLRPGGDRDSTRQVGDAFAFEVHLHQAPQQQAASVVRQLKQSLNRAGIRHDIIMLHDDAGISD